jgi:hypothetical protein
MTRTPTRVWDSTLALATLLAAASCAPDAVAPTGVDGADPVVAEARSADRCMNVDIELVADLGVWMLDGAVVPGAAPVHVTLGGIDGWLGSVLETPNDPPQGGSETLHWGLTHVFFTGAPVPVDITGGGFFVPAVNLAQQDDWFMTDDQAVCAAAGRGPLVCRVNDRMPIVDGSGMFQNAEGFLHNHGWITITNPQVGSGYGEFHARGRVCGDGIH